MILRAQTLPKSRAGGVPVLGAKLPDLAERTAPDRKAVLPSCAHTHLHSQRHLALACLRSAPARSPTASHSCAPALETPTRSQKLPREWPELSRRLPLCRDAPTQLWGWFCPVGANPVSLPPLFQTLRAATRPGEGAERSPAQGSAALEGFGEGWAALTLYCSELRDPGFLPH